MTRRLRIGGEKKNPELCYVPKRFSEIKAGRAFVLFHTKEWDQIVFYKVNHLRAAVYSNTSDEEEVGDGQIFPPNFLVYPLVTKADYRRRVRQEYASAIGIVEDQSGM